MSLPKAGPPLANLLIAGVTKSGTTSLFRYLAQHPDVCPSDVKEPRYFEALMSGEPLAPLEGYRRHFAHCRGEQYRMEASPGYCEGGRVVADAVDRTLPGVRVVVSLRDPVERCWSWYRYHRGDGRIPGDMSFAAYIDRCEEVHTQGVNVRRAKLPFGALGSGCYDTWLPAWLDVLGPRFRVEFFEAMAGDPRSVVTGLCDWLGIDPDVCADFEFAVANKTARYRHARLQRSAVALNRAGKSFFSAHPAVRRAVRAVYYGFNRIDSEPAEERMDPVVRQRLEHFYSPHNERLALLLAAVGTGELPAWLGGSSSA